MPRRVLTSSLSSLNAHVDYSQLTDLWLNNMTSKGFNTYGSAVAVQPSQAEYQQTLRDAIDAYEKEHGRQTVNEQAKISKSRLAMDDDATSVATKGRKLDELPNELVELIFARLEGIDLGYMRLMCRKFAILAAPSLFKDGFSIKPHRQDMIRLARVCLSPALAVGIKELMVFMGDMNKHQFFAALHSFQMGDETVPVEPVNRLFDKFSDHLDKELLAACFSQLPNVITITTYSEESPFTEEANNWTSVSGGVPSHKAIAGMISLDSAWEHMHGSHADFDRTHFLNPEVSSQRTLNLILALEALPHKPISIHIDSLPLDIFAKDFQHLKRDFNLDALPPIAVDEQKAQAMQKAVKHIEGFEAAFDGSGKQDVIYTGAPLAQAVTGFIGSMRNLKRLTINWQPEEEFDVDFATAFDESFFKLRFPHLEELRLADLCSVRAVVVPFILGHSSTLLRLGWTPNYTEGTEDVMEELWQTESIMPTEDDRTWRDVFTDIRDKMTKLVAVEVNDVESDAVLYEYGWKPIPVSPRGRVSIMKLLEHFILGKLPWPMKHDDPRPYRGWKAKHTTTNQEFDAYSRETLAELYSDEWETDREDGEEESDSEDTDSEDEEYGADDDDDVEMDEFYDEDFDAFMEDEGMDDFDFAQMSHAMQAMMPGVLSFGAGAPGYDDEWEDEDEDVSMDNEDEDGDIPGAVEMSALGGEVGLGQVAEPVDIGRPGGWGMPVADLKAALGYESDPDEH